MTVVWMFKNRIFDCVVFSCRCFCVWLLIKREEEIHVVKSLPCCFGVPVVVGGVWFIFACVLVLITVVDFVVVVDFVAFLLVSSPGNMKKNKRQTERWTEWQITSFNVVFSYICCCVWLYLLFSFFILIFLVLFLLLHRQLDKSNLKNPKNCEW